MKKLETQNSKEIIATKHHKFHLEEPFYLENGEVLSNLEIAYTTTGELNSDLSNVIWVCHALTANSDPFEWWPGLVGNGDAIDPEKHFIVCANMIGSCYGSTCPNSINPETGNSYAIDFPLVTTRDMARAHQLLFEHLKLSKVKLLIGGSMGGQQALEWSIQNPKQVDQMILLATNAQHSAWGIAYNATQRMALEAVPGFLNGNIDDDLKGLKAARAIAMLSYRSPEIYNERQTDLEDKSDHFKAEDYQRYQGKKLAERFDPYSYYALSKSMDSHNLSRNRGTMEEVLKTITAKTFVIGIETDGLFIPDEQQFLAKYIPDSKFELIKSIYGHDGFLVEAPTISKLIIQHLNI